MAKSNETQNDATLPLWRINYGYTVKGALRTGSYIFPAASAAEAKAQAEKVLHDKFTGTESYYRINTVKPF